MRSSGRRPLLAALAAIAVGGPALLLVTRLASDPTATVDASSATGTRAESTEPPRIGEPPPPADLSAFGWLLADVVEDADGPQARYRIMAGDVADGAPSLTVEVPFPLVEAFGMTGRRPPVAGPVAGRVVYVADDGVRSAVHSVAVDDPADDRVIAEIDEVVWSVAMHPDGSTAYLQLVARDAGNGPPREVGVVGMALAGGGIEAVLAPAELEASGQVRRVALVAFQAGLLLAADGSMLARSVCTGPDSCRTDVVDLRTGASWSHGRLDIVAMVPGVVVVRDPCEDVPPFACSLTAIDLRTDARRVLADDVQGAQQAALDGRGIVVYGTRIRLDTTNATELRAVDPVDGRDIHLFDAAPGGAIHVGFATFYHPPDGWTVVDTETGTIGVSLLGAEPTEIFLRLDGPEPACTTDCVQG